MMSPHSSPLVNCLPPCVTRLKILTRTTQRHRPFSAVQRTLAAKMLQKIEKGGQTSMNHQDRRRDGPSRGQIPWARTFLWMFLVGCWTTSFYFSLSIAVSMLQSFHLDFNLSFSGTKLVLWCLSQNEQRFRCERVKVHTIRPQAT